MQLSDSTGPEEHIPIFHFLKFRNKRASWCTDRSQDLFTHFSHFVNFVMFYTFFEHVNIFNLCFFNHQNT